jgi:hypothetical protein
MAFMGKRKRNSGGCQLPIKNASVGRVGLGFFSFSPGGGPGFHRPGHSPS